MGSSPNSFSPGSQGTRGIRTESVGGSSISDQATDQDQLGFGPYVESVAAFLTHKDTKPPLAISVEGGWGSGKSSFMLLLQKAIISAYEKNGYKPKTVWFNAWRFDKDEAVWAAFALAVTEKLAESMSWWKRNCAHLRLQWQRFEWKKGWFDLAKFAVTLMFLTYVAVAVLRYAKARPEALNPIVAPFTKSEPPPKDVGQTNPAKPAEGLSSSAIEKAPEKALQKYESEGAEKALVKLLIAAGGGAGYLLLTGMFLKKLLETVGNPFKIDLQKFSGSLSYEERISFIQRFHSDFGNIVDSYAEGQTVFVFIDDLDRCELPKAADLMQAINLLMDESSKVVYVLGLDREKIAAGLAAKFEKVLPYLSDQRSKTSGYSGMDFGYDYLEKFIQIPFQVPHPADANIERLLASFNSTAATEKQDAPQISNVSPGILFETRTDSPLVKDIVKMVAPALDYNPRRIKQFINCFRLGAIVASRTGLFGPSPNPGEYPAFTPEQLGKLIAIYLRYPILLSDAAADHGLLARLETIGFHKISDGASDLERYWNSKRTLMELLLHDVDPDVNTLLSNFSLAQIDIERYLKVSPPIAAHGHVATAEFEIEVNEPAGTETLDESSSDAPREAPRGRGRPSKMK
jgi:KAP family P-loop domain